MAKLAMSSQTLEDAVIVIQEASAAITQISSKLSCLQSNNDDVVNALKDLSNKVSEIQTKQANSSNDQPKPPLYIRVSQLISAMQAMISFLL